jgi:hippurate hydrolase
MQIPHLINLLHGEMTAWREDLHAHPELGFEEHRRSEFAAGKLSEFGCEVHRNIGKTGVVGVLRTGDGPSIGLRADMDALPIHEANDIPYRSQYEGRMRACGHDGHTTMLLGAARYLAETRDFAGTYTSYFSQPRKASAARRP